MGTRGLLGFIIAGRRRASYNHFDSYPSGLGAQVAKFILGLKEGEKRAMLEHVRNLTWFETSTEPNTELQEKYSKLGFSDTKVSNQKLSDWYCLLRKVQGANALPKILDGTLKHMPDDTSMLKDVEWSYFIDLEEDKLEVYESETLLKTIDFADLKESF